MRARHELLRGVGLQVGRAGGKSKSVYCIMCDIIAALWWLPGAGVGMVVRFAGSYIIKSNDAPRVSAGKGGMRRPWQVGGPFGLAASAGLSFLYSSCV